MDCNFICRSEKEGVTTLSLSGSHLPNVCTYVHNGEGVFRYTSENNSVYKYSAATHNRVMDIFNRMLAHMKECPVCKHKCVDDLLSMCSRINSE